MDRRLNIFIIFEQKGDRIKYFFIRNKSVNVDSIILKGLRWIRPVLLLLG